MITINLPTLKHREPANYTDPTTGDIFRWTPFRDARQLTMLRSAISMLEAKLKNHRPCNDAFQSLPGGCSFRQVLNDRRIWISLAPSTRNGYFGVTTGNDVAISAFTFRMGIWTVAGTLVQELAHVNGAPGGIDQQAEQSLVPCLLTDVYNPGVYGRVVQPGFQPLTVFTRRNR